ncbi:MAG: hypothetical protein V4594_24080 [Bacteroidota bacterium]
MKKTTVFILLLCMYHVTVSAQRIESKPTSKKAMNLKKVAEWEQDFIEENSDCAYYNKYTPKQRLGKYPFSEASQVMAVSYKYTDHIEPEVVYSNLNLMESKDSIISIDKSPKQGLIIKNKILDTTTLIEKKVLNPHQIDMLTNLIFNTDYKKKAGIHMLDFGKCFEPRNAFIFLDSNGLVLDYLEMCFTCLQNQSLSDKFDIGVYCTQKYQMFSDYFKQVGVNYGILGRDYPAEDMKEKSSETNKP